MGLLDVLNGNAKRPSRRAGPWPPSFGGRDTLALPAAGSGDRCPHSCRACPPQHTRNVCHERASSPAPAYPWIIGPNAKSRG
jgi:hypothetical protein